MRIGEVARRAGVRVSRIRYYEEVGVLPEAERVSGQRRYDDRVLRLYDPARVPLGTRVTNVWLPPVHYGEVGGLATRVLACAAGLVPAGLYVTGILLWRRRTRRG